MNEAPIVSPLVLVVPASIALLLLIVHSVRTRGGRLTAGFLFLCAAWYVPKERAVAAQAFNDHLYVFSDAFLRLAGVPIAAPIGYAFAGLLSWHLGSRLMRGLPGLEGRLFPTVVAWLLFTSAIAYVMETTGVVAGWWSWQIDEAPRHWGLLDFDKRMEFNEGQVWPAIPDIPVWGWPIFAAPLAFLFLALELGPFARFDRARRTAGYLLGFVGYFVLLQINPFPAILALVVAAFFARTPLARPASSPAGTAALSPPLEIGLPIVAALLMLGVSAYVNLYVAQDPRLLISWLPFVLFSILAHLGRATLPVALAAFVVLLVLRTNGVGLVHHATLFLGAILAMSAVHVRRNRRALRAAVDEEAAPSPAED